MWTKGKRFDAELVGNDFYDLNFSPAKNKINGITAY
jgi:hypothetical protein